MNLSRKIYKGFEYECYECPVCHINVSTPEQFDKLMAYDRKDVNERDNGD